MRPIPKKVCFMNHYIPSTQKEFDHIVSGFQNKILPAAEWTHEAHLITGLWHVAQFGYTDALNKMRTNIKAYNEATGGINSDTSGYHETITIFWLWLSDEFWKQNALDDKTFEELCNTFLKSKYANRNAIFIFYSREKLFSVEARKNFVEPDIQAFNLLVI